MGDNLIVAPGTTLFKKQYITAQLSLLSNLCSTVNQTVNATLGVLYQKHLVTAQVLTRDVFEYQINLTVDRVYLEMKHSFQNTFNLLQSIIHANGIMSNYFTNWRIENRTLTSSADYQIVPMSYDNCSCGISSNCSQPMIIGNRSITGLLIGCLPLSALLQSNLKCFFNETCVEMLHDVLFENININFSAIRLPGGSRFPVNESVASILNELFIERWSRHEDYEAYFKKCLLAACSYGKILNVDILYAITNTIGLGGGLTIVLRLICPLMAATYYYLISITKMNSVNNVLS